jgi:putative membrane protein
MRMGEDLPGSKFPAFLAIVVAVGAVLLIALVLVRALE